MFPNLHRPGGPLARCLLVLALVVPTSADVILDWSEITLDAIRADRTAPPRAGRALAMVHVAMFDAVNAVSQNYDPYLDLNVTVRAGTSREAAAATAAHRVLVALFPGQSAAFDAALANTLGQIADGQSQNDGEALGIAVGDAMLALRNADGSGATVAYTVGTEPGDWQPTPPAFAAAVLPQWPDVTPFCIPDIAQVRRPGPPALTSAEYATSFNEVKALGEVNSTARTADQTQIAFFWVDGPGTATPPGHWFQIARDVANQRGTSLEENARLFALLGMAECDAGICAWDNKYAYDDWRPVTAIRAADTDGNPDTEPDPAWTPLIPTPPFPSYTSGHSTFSGAGGKILALFFGRDDLPFSTASDDVPGVTRNFNRFSEASNEAGRSRIYGGIHWEYDNQDGLSTGRELALYVFDHFLQPRPIDVIELDPNDVLQCGPVGLFPLGLLMLTLAGWRAAPRRR